MTGKEKQRIRRSSDVDGRISGKNQKRQHEIGLDGEDFSNYANRVSFEEEEEIDYENLIMQQTNIEEKQYDRKKQDQQRKERETENNRQPIQEQSRRRPETTPLPRKRGEEKMDSGFHQVGAKKKKRKRIIWTIVLVLSVLILAGVAFAASKLSKVDKIKLDNLETNDLSAGTKEKLSGYTTLA